MTQGLRIPLLGAVMVLCACTATTQLADVQFRPPAGAYKLIVMQPDISVGVLTAGGMVEVRADWSDQARQNVARALVAQQARRGGETHVSVTPEDTGADPALTSDLLRLHMAVGNTIRTHKYLGQGLPTKTNKFD